MNYEDEKSTVGWWFFGAIVVLLVVAAAWWTFAPEVAPQPATPLYRIEAQGYAYSTGQFVQGNDGCVRFDKTTICGSYTIRQEQ